MTSITVHDAEMDVWHRSVSRSRYGDPDEPPDVTIPGGRIENVQFAARASRVMDEAQFELRYPTTSDYDLRFGDRIQFNATVSTGPGGGYAFDYGDQYGGGELNVDWTGHVNASSRSTAHEGSTGNTLSATATDWCGGILSDRTVTRSWVDEDIGQIIRDIVAGNATEVDASNIPDFGVSTDSFFQSKDCWEAIVSLASIADVLLYQRGVELHATPITELETAFELTPDDYTLPWKTQTEDDPYNVVRVDSGVSRQQEQAQEQQDEYEYVDQTNRKTKRLRARKSEIHSVELWVNAESEDDMRVRLQADEDGAPVAPYDEDSDIINESLPDSSLPSDGGWETFFLAEHTLPDRDPWLIIETDGDGGHEVGVHSTAGLTFRSFYPHPLNFEATANESIREFGPRDLRIERDNLQTLVSTRDAALMELARRAWPMKTIEFDADSPRCHSLETGDIILVDNPPEDAVGEFIVTEMEQTFSADTVQLATSVTAEWRKGVLAEV